MCRNRETARSRHIVAKACLCGALLAAIVAICGQRAGAQTTASLPTTEVIQPGAGHGPVSLADLEQLALELNPTLVQAGAQVRISRGKAIQAGLAPNPTVGYVAEQIGAEGTAGELHGMFVEQQIVTGGKLQLSRAKFIQEARQAELQVLAQRFRVLQGVRLAYYEALVRQRRLALRQHLLQNTEETNKTLTELVNVGQANQTDLLQAQVQLHRAQAELQRAESRLQGAYESMAAVVGMPQLSRGPLTDSLELQSPERIDREMALANLLACSPELRFAQSEVARDRIAVERERREPIPNINLRAEAGYNFEAEDSVAGFEVGIRLPVWDQNQGTIMQAQAELMRARAEVQRIELLLRKRFAETFANYESAAGLADSYRREILPKSQEAYQTYLDSFQNRRAAWPQVVDAQRDYLQHYDEYLDYLHEARRAETRINTFFLDDGLSQPQEPTPEGHRDATPRPR
jgi:outer membrane protein, heavy metal efflux system